MAFTIKFNEEKNQLLKTTRGISFEDAQDVIEKGYLLADIVHPSKKHSHQQMYVVQIKRYIYAVPYIINAKKREIFLKTVYPSRVLTKRYMKGGKNEETNK